MKKRYFITIGFALFAMFFGAGNLIFPPTLGKLAGDQFLLSTIGFLITGVGLPFLGILAVAKAGGGVEFFAARVNGNFAK
ncbi:branched-chain amino acid transport system II carrier protein, partial [Patescibacteria group bacterium]|nr:branched-chain amino acid transport system II carrier protein [Patescibacteria group bacterium]